MPSQDLSKNMLINIGLYYNEINKKIFEDFRFRELQEILSEEENLNKYTYSLYSDTNLLSNNLFMPIFHSIYLGSGVTNVVLESEQDLWLVSSFPNNRYFFIGDNEELSKHENIRIINSLKEINGII